MLPKQGSSQPDSSFKIPLPPDMTNINLSATPSKPHTALEEAKNDPMLKGLVEALEKIKEEKNKTFLERFFEQQRREISGLREINKQQKDRICTLETRITTLEMEKERANKLHAIRNRDMKSAVNLLSFLNDKAASLQEWGSQEMKFGSFMDDLGRHMARQTKKAMDDLKQHLPAPSDKGYVPYPDVVQNPLRTKYPPAIKNAGPRPPHAPPQ